MANAKPTRKRTARSSGKSSQKAKKAKPAMPPLTAEQARARQEEKGVTIADFARQNGLRYHTVQTVLAGKKKGRYGEAHKAAVALGMKAGVIVCDV